MNGCNELCVVESDNIQETELKEANMPCDNHATVIIHERMVITSTCPKRSTKVQY